MKVVWSPLAEQRALEAVDFIAADNRRALAEWLEGLLARVGTLDRFAGRGREVPEIANPKYREILYAPYRVIYRVDEGEVVILALRHQRRAWDAGELPALR